MDALWHWHRLGRLSPLDRPSLTFRTPVLGPRRTRREKSTKYPSEPSSSLGFLSQAVVMLWFS